MTELWSTHPFTEENILAYSSSVRLILVGKKGTNIWWKNGEIHQFIKAGTHTEVF